MSADTRTGFSLRQSLTQNGVTEERSVRAHLSFVYNTLQANKQLRIDRYRPNPKAPNSIPLMG